MYTETTTRLQAVSMFIRVIRGFPYLQFLASLGVLAANAVVVRQ
jgi:hypothetical protein